MKVWVIHAEEGTQVCSTREKAKQALELVIKKWCSEANISLASESDNEVVFNVTYPPKWDEEFTERFWIYAYEVDGGPIC